MDNELFTREIVYQLLLAWPKAWDKYKGYLKGAGALPGIALIEAADLVKEEERRPELKYLWSKIRSDINLAFQQAKSAGWLSMVDVNSSKLVSCMEAFIYVLGRGYEPEIPKLVADHDGPDFRWWVRTDEGESKAIEVMRLRTEDRKAPIGFKLSKSSG